MLCDTGSVDTGKVINKKDEQKVLDQHHDNQFAEDIPFMGGEGTGNGQNGKKKGASGTGLSDPGNVHTQASMRLTNDNNNNNNNIIINNNKNNINNTNNPNSNNSNNNNNENNTNNNKDSNACRPRLGACKASLSSPGRVVLSALISFLSMHAARVLVQ